MYGDGDSKVYVRFRDEVLEDLDSDWYLEVEWAGGSTFNIYSNNQCVDAFTHHGDDKGNPPTFEQAWKIAEECFAEARTALIDAVGDSSD